jgi:quercetin dioxygenase-like cupin family protein
LFLDRQFVKVSANDTGGLYTIIEDELEPGCELGLHLHREHMETFYILEGEIELTLDDKTFPAAADTVFHVPQNTPHAIRANKPARILVIRSPGGFEDLLETYTQLSSDQFEDSAMLRSIDEQHDIIYLAE